MNNLNENRLINNNPSIEGVLTGIRKASDIITSTMGGSGKNVLMFENKIIQFTKDGVSVAKKIQFPNSEEDAGAKMLITAAKKTVQECGDGTTLTSLLTIMFVNSLFEECSQPNADINNIIDSWEKDLNLFLTELKQRSNKIEKLDNIYQIALTSCKNENLAQLIHEIYRKVGLKASISVQLEPDNPKSYYEITKGLNFDGGLIHQQFANQLNGTFQAEKAKIWIFEDVLSDFREYASIVNELHEQKIPVVFIAKDFSSSFIQYALTNKINKNIQICLLRLPGWGAGVKENIKDMKAFITKDSVNRISVTPTDFTLYNNPDVKKIRNRVKQLEAQMEGFTEDFDIIDFGKRIDNLNQTSAIIYVGGRTLANAQEEFDRIEDAVGACKSACKGGYVKGAGAELFELSKTLNVSDKFKEVLRSPFYKILTNANHNPETVLELPFNVKTKKQDLTLLDPTDVIVSAFSNSFSLATLLINTSYILYD